MFKFIHLSDFHLGKRNLNEVAKRVSRLLDVSGAPLDAVVLTGDLTATGTAEEFQMFEASVLPGLTELVVGQDVRRVATVLGNHDVDRSRIDSFIQGAARAQMSKPNEMDSLWRDRRTDVLERFTPYSDFVRRSGVSASSNHMPPPNGEPSVALLHLNSAWLAADDKDRGQLVVTAAQFDEALESLQPLPEIVVAMSHHPLSWLEETDARLLRDSIDKHIDLFLTGHVHSDDARSSHGPVGLSSTISARAFSSGVSPDGFNAIAIDLKTRAATVRYYRWSERNGQFVVDTEAGSGGEWVLPLPPRQTHSRQALLARDHAFDSMRRAAERNLERLPILTSSAGILPVTDRFVQPHIVAMRGGRDKRVDVSEIVRDGASYLIEGGVQSGKSALLDYVCLVGGKGMIRVDFGVIVPGDRLHDLIATTCNLSKNKARALSKLPLVLLVDNASDEFESPIWKLLREWTSRDIDPVRVVATTARKLLPSSAADALGAWKHCSLRPLPYSQVKATLAGLAKQMGRGMVPVERAMASLLEAELPRLPWVLAILVELASHSEVPTVSSIYDLLKRYVAMRLSTLSADAPSRAKWYRRVLGAAANKLTTDRSDRLPTAELKSLFSGLFVASNVPDEADEIFEELTAARLLSWDPDTNQVSFTFFVLQEMFFAEYLAESRWGGAPELDAEEFVRISGSLSFLAEIVNAPEILVRAIRLLDAGAGTVGDPVSCADLQQIRWAVNEDADGAIDGVRRHVVHDSELDRGFSQAEKSTVGTRLRRVSGQAATNTVSKGFQELYAAIIVLRGSAWMDGVAKRTAVEKIIRHAACLLGTMIRDEEIVRRIAATGIDIKGREQISAIISTMLIILVGLVVASVGGGAHLSLTLEKAIGEEGDELRKILLVMWYAEVGGSGVKDAVKGLLGRGTSFVGIQIVELWLKAQFGRALTFAHASAADMEDLLRVAIAERLRRSADRRQPGFRIADMVEQDLQAAQSRRSADDGE